MKFQENKKTKILGLKKEINPVVGKEEQKKEVCSSPPASNSWHSVIVEAQEFYEDERRKKFFLKLVRWKSFQYKLGIR